MHAGGRRRCGRELAFLLGVIVLEESLGTSGCLFPIVRIPKRRQVLSQTVGHCFLFLFFSDTLILMIYSIDLLKEVLGT